MTQGIDRKPFIYLISIFYTCTYLITKNQKGFFAKRIERSSVIKCNHRDYFRVKNSCLLWSLSVLIEGKKQLLVQNVIFTAVTQAEYSIIVDATSFTVCVMSRVMSLYSPPCWISTTQSSHPDGLPGL